MHSSFTRGFTVVELMIAVALFAIIVSIGVPSFQSLVANNRLTSVTNQLVGDLHYARSEALKLRQDVTLCRSANPAATTPTCGGTANTWSTGWLIYADADPVGAYDPNKDTLLRIAANIPDTVTVRANATADASGRLTFRANGRLGVALGSTAIFTVCDDRNGDGTLDASHGRAVSMTSSGALTTEGGSNGSISSCTPN